MKDKNFKITLQAYDEKFSIEKDYPDVTFDDYMEMVRKISIAMYSEYLWDKYWNEQETK